MDVSGWIIITIIITIIFIVILMIIAIIITIIVIVILIKSKFKEHGECSDFTQITLKVAVTFECELGLFCFQKAE